MNARRLALIAAFCLTLGGPAFAVTDTAARYSKQVGEWGFDYTPLRQGLHDDIVERRLRAGVSDERPRLIFTAGGFGAGKSFVTSALERLGVVDVARFVWIDPDSIKEDLPEYAELKISDPAGAATIVHRESGHVQEELTEAALGARKNTIIDGSLRARAWWESEFRRIRAQYPDYSISIFYVTAPLEKLLTRVHQRSLVTGRHIPPEMVRETAVEVRDSVNHLAQFADLTIEIENGDSPTIKSIRRGDTEVAAHLNLFAERAVEAPALPAAGPWPADQPIVVLAGYGIAGYEDYSLLRSYVKQVAARFDPETLFVFGTELGIGRAREWLPHARISDLAGITALFDDPARRGKIEVFSFRGGPAAASVITLAAARAIPVTLIRDPGLEPQTESLAVRLMRDPQFDADATRIFETRPGSVRVVRSLSLPEGFRVREARTRRLRQIYRRIETLSDRELVATALDAYPELILLTEGTVAIPEAQSSRETPAATQSLPAELARLGAPSRGYPARIAEVPEDLTHSLSTAIYGKAYPELDRTISMLLLFKRLVADDYEGFVRGQPEPARLSRESFDELSGFIRRVAYDADQRDALFSFLIFNNVGKARPVIEYLRRAGHIQDFNHQRIMAEVLKTYGFISPTFLRLDESQHRLLISAFEKEFALGQVIQGELPARYLTEFPSRTPRERDFYLATLMLKVAAGRGHVAQLGSIVMTQATYDGIRAAVHALEKMDDRPASAVRAQKEFVAARAASLLPPDADVWVTRVCLMFRCLGADEGRRLWAATRALPVEDRARLRREFEATGFGTDSALLLYYATAVFDNLRKVTSAEDLFPRGLALLGQILTVARAAATAQNLGGVIQVRLDHVAQRIRDDGERLSVRFVACDGLLTAAPGAAQQ